MTRYLRLGWEQVPDARHSLPSLRRFPIVNDANGRLRSPKRHRILHYSHEMKFFRLPRAVFTCVV
jgi:hypothetical protein